MELSSGLVAPWHVFGIWTYVFPLTALISSTYGTEGHQMHDTLCNKMPHIHTGLRRLTEPLFLAIPSSCDIQKDKHVK